MKRFRFPLEALLEVRAREERARQGALAELQSQRVEVESKISACQHAIERTKEDLRDVLRGGQETDAGRTLRMHAGGALHHQARAQQLVVQLAGIHSRIAKAREALAEASRARRAVELLREKRYDQWKKEVQRRETLELDDLAVMRHGRIAGIEVGG